MIRRPHLPLLTAAALAVCLTAFTGARAADAESDAFRPGELSSSVTIDRDGSSASALVARARRGKIVVRNRSGFTADVYLGPDDGVSELLYVDTLPTGFKLTIRGLPRRTGYVLYAEEPDASGSWGPRAFFLRKKYVWTLLGPE
jgi:hypothetical protein